MRSVVLLFKLSRVLIQNLTHVPSISLLLTAVDLNLITVLHVFRSSGFTTIFGYQTSLMTLPDGWWKDIGLILSWYKQWVRLLTYLSNWADGPIYRWMIGWVSLIVIGGLIWREVNCVLLLLSILWSPAPTAHVFYQVSFVLDSTLDLDRNIFLTWFINQI